MLGIRPGEDRRAVLLGQEEEIAAPRVRVQRRIDGRHGRGADRPRRDALRGVRVVGGDRRRDARRKRRLQRGPEDVADPFRDRQPGQLERVVHVEDGGVGPQEPGRLGVRVDTVLEDAGDLGLLRVEARLLLHDGRHREDLGPGEAPGGRHLHALWPHARHELVQHHPHQVLRRGVGQELVVTRGQVPLERSSLRDLQPGVVPEERGRRVADQVQERLGRHREAGEAAVGGLRLDQRCDLLKAQAGPDRERHVGDGRRRRREERRGELVGRHRLPDDEAPRLVTRRNVAFHGDEHERLCVPQDAGDHQPVRDRGGGVAWLDHERHVGHIGSRGLRQRRPEILADHVGHEPDPERAGVLARHARDESTHDGTPDRREHDQDQPCGDEQERREPEQAAAGPAATPPCQLRR